MLRVDLQRHLKVFIGLRYLALCDQRSAKIEMQRSGKIETPSRIVRFDAQGSGKTFCRLGQLSFLHQGNAAVVVGHLTVRVFADRVIPKRMDIAVNGRLRPGHNGEDK